MSGSKYGFNSDPHVDKKISPLKYAFFTNLFLKALLYRKKKYIRDLVKHIKYYRYTYFAFKHPVFKIVHLLFRVEYRTENDFCIEVKLTLYDLPKYMKTYFDKFSVYGKDYNSIHMSWTIYTKRPNEYRISLSDYECFDRGDLCNDNYRFLVTKNTHGPSDSMLPYFIFDVIKSWNGELTRRYKWHYSFTAMSRRHLSIFSKLK